MYKDKDNQRDTGKDKRRFKRYRRKSNFQVEVCGKSFKAETVDYSADGVRAQLEDSPPINVGDVVDLNISQPDISSHGKVVWSQKNEVGTLVGISRMGLISGSLQDFSLSDIVLGLQRSGKTGLLHIISKPVHKSTYIENGVMIFARSNVPTDRLSNYLLSEGKITQDQFAKAMDVVSMTGKRQGTVLVELGYVEPEYLVNAVRASVERIIESLFSVRDGEFLFKEGFLPTKELIKLRLSAANLIYRGIKAMQDADYVSSLCPVSDIEVGFSPNPLDLFQDVELTFGDKELLKIVEGTIKVGDLVAASGTSELETQKSICALLGIRLLEISEDAGPREAISAESVLEEAPEVSAREIVAEIERMYINHESLGYYGVLGISENAKSQDIKRSYYNAARKFHPDRHFNLEGDIKEKLNSVFTYVTIAYSTLISPDQRREYDEMPKDARGESSESNEILAERRFREGLSELKNNNFAEASRLFGAAAYMDASQSKYHYFSGVSLSGQGKHREAERAISRALKADPFNAAYLVEAGHIFLAMGLPLRARGNFQKAIKIEPLNRRAQEGMDKVLAQTQVQE